MYKSEIGQALGQLALVPGGNIEEWLAIAQRASVVVDSALQSIVSGEEQKVAAGNSALREALKPSAERLSSYSFMATAIEIHELTKRFDAVLDGHPELESLLRSGRQALSDLAGALDEAVKRPRRDALIALIPPALELQRSYAYYHSLRELFRSSTPGEHDHGRRVILELEELPELYEFAQFVMMVSALAHAAGVALESSKAESGDRDPVYVSAIESGSPIKITLFGGKDTIKLMLAMIRDAVRTTYQSFVPHGRLNQAMDTLARAKELGIDSQRALDALSGAVEEAAETYRDTFKRHRVGVSIDGQPVQPPVEQRYALPSPSLPVERVLEQEKSKPQLEGPKKD